MAHGSGDGEADAAPGAASGPERLLAPLARLGGAFSALLILACLAMTVWSAAMRCVFSDPPGWIDEFAGWTPVALICLVPAEALGGGAHIAIDPPTGSPRGRARRLQLVRADPSAILFALVLGLRGAVVFNPDCEACTSGAVEIEARIPLAPTPLGAALPGLFAAARLTGPSR